MKAGRGLLCGLAQGGGSYDATGLQVLDQEADESMLVQMAQSGAKDPKSNKEEHAETETFLACDSEEELEMGDEAYAGADYSNVSETSSEVVDRSKGTQPGKQRASGHGPGGAYTFKDWRAIQEAGEWNPIRLQQHRQQEGHPSASSSAYGQRQDGQPQEVEPEEELQDGDYEAEIEEGRAAWNAAYSIKPGPHPEIQFTANSDAVGAGDRAPDGAGLCRADEQER